MSRLWDKGQALDQVIERFTVGRDPQLDQFLLPYDALGSAAHACMLEAIGILQNHEVETLTTELRSIATDARRGTFFVAQADEDSHTAIENRLTERLGESGRKIHTGRSRNDQVICALRLFGRESLLEITAAGCALIEELLRLADAERETSMPGFTHTRQAMPSTFGFLLAAHAEGLLDCFKFVQGAYQHINRSPLGSASGYGVGLPLDRQLVSDLLRFDSIQPNTLAVQNDRGRGEYVALGAALLPVVDMARLSGDLIYFSSDELRWLSLDASVTTGSSIMPQKRNPDVLELIRASSARLRARHAEVGAIYGGLASGYHRDLQLTKEPFIEGLCLAEDALRAMLPVLQTLSIDRQRAKQAIQASTAATDEVYRRVAQGVPFRDAYREIGKDPAGSVTGAVHDTWRNRTHLGAPGSLDLKPYEADLEALRQWLETQRASCEGAWKLLDP